MSTHNTATLQADSDMLVRRFRQMEEFYQKDWFTEQEEDWRKLRDLITTKLRRKEVITGRDVEAVNGSTDLDRYRHRVSSPGAVVYRSHLGVIARLRQTRPRGYIDVTFKDLVAFRDLMLTMTSETVTDQQLSDLGFNRFPAVVTRLTLCDNVRLMSIPDVY